MLGLIAGFRRNTRGNVAIIVGAAAIPLIAVVGCVVDYTMATTIRAKLQAGADSATLAAISFNSPLIPTAQAMSQDGSVAGGSNYLQTFFDSNVASVATTGTSGVTTAGTPYQITSSSVTKTGKELTATVSFTAQVPTAFLNVIGFPNVSISGTSTSSYFLAAYVDFYLMIDVSGSMGFPTTPSEQTRLGSVNPDNLSQYPTGCQFACHFNVAGFCPQNGRSPPVGYSSNPSPGGYCQGYVISRLGTSVDVHGNTVVNWGNSQVSSCPSPGGSNCIQLRLDAVGYAVNQLLTQAYNTETNITHIPNQFAVGLYPFIVDLYAYFPLTTNINATGAGTINNAAANLATLLDTGHNVSLGSGGTHFDRAFPDLNNLITSVGTGASRQPSNTLPFVFLITDGVNNSQTYAPFTGSNPAVLDTSYCTTLKNRGITIGVLYTPYVPINPPNASFAGNEDGKVNAIIPPSSTAVPDALRACASAPNFYIEANSPDDINQGLTNLFNQALHIAHVTN
jgi:Flp pilus assembly protein TadG